MAGRTRSRLPVWQHVGHVGHPQTPTRLSRVDDHPGAQDLHVGHKIHVYGPRHTSASSGHRGTLP